MPLRIKSNLNNLRPMERAARRRVTDDGFNDRSSKDIDALTNRYMRDGNQLRLPLLNAGDLLSSHNHREYLRDSKFFVSLNNEQLTGMEAEIENSSKEAFGILEDMQKEAEGLNALISEEEIKLHGVFTNVHYNSFVRQIDMGLSFDHKKWLTDFKTELPFQAQNIASLIPGTGLTLPLRERVFVPIIDAVLVGEETDVGDSRKPIQSTDPRNVFLPDKVFRHVILRKEHDKTSRKFNHTPSYCTIQLELPSFQLVNFVRVDPVAHRGLVIDNVSFVNEAGEVVSLDITNLELETGRLVLFEPIRTRFLKLKFRGFAPISKAQYNVKDWRVKELNDVIIGAGWTQRLPEQDEVLDGRIFDFSIQNIKVGLRTYEPLGIYRSRPVKVKGVRGVALAEKSEAIRITSEGRTYGSNFTLPDGVVLNEYYLGVRLQDRARNTRIDTLIPIPDSYPVQREFLPLVGGESKAKLFPDMTWDLEKVLVTDVEKSTDSYGYVALCKTPVEHGFSIGDTVALIGPADYGLVGDHLVTSVPSLTSFGISLSAWGSYIRDENNLPRLYAYGVSAQEDPIVVNKKNTTLTVGIDYQISLDGGSTWHTTFPRGAEFITALTDPQAGNFKLRFTIPDYSSSYWIEYRPYKNQNLSQDKLIRLRNGRVIFDRSLSEARGSISTVVVSRTESANQHITPVVVYYALKVRENVA